MINQLQVAFLGSFICTFALLFYISRIVNALFVPSQIILIGLPKDPAHPEMGRYQFEDYLNAVSENIRNFSLNDLKTVDPGNLIEVASSPTFLLTAGILVATLVWTRVIHTGTFVHFARQHAHSMQGVLKVSTQSYGKSILWKRKSRFPPILPRQSAIVFFFPFSR
jgi:hypothetical protein